MQVSDILSQKGAAIHQIGPDATVFDAISLMSEKNVGALLVMTGGRLQGIISERDYRNKVILKGRMSKQTPVKTIMTRDVFCVTPEETLENCMAIMTSKKIRHLPVMTKDTVVGVISIGDLVKAMIDKQQVEIKNLKHYIAGTYPA